MERVHASSGASSLASNSQRGYLHSVPDLPLARDPRLARLQGRKALVTGGEGTLGRAIAVAYAEEGADVALVHELDQEGAEETKRRVERLGRTCILLHRDVRDPAQCRSAVNEACLRLEGLNVLVNVADYRELHDHFEDVGEVEIRRTFETTIFGSMYFAQAALAHLRAGDSIINTGSVAALLGHPRSVPHTASSAAIHAFTKSLALQLGERGIRVNAVVPATGTTEVGSALGRAPEPEELAPAYVFLASDDASFVTGALYEVTGGAATPVPPVPPSPPHAPHPVSPTG